MYRLLSNLITKSLAITLFLFFIPTTSLYADEGCCSHHGGVSGCNTATNHQSCKDGTTSPTCLCSGEKAASVKGCCAKHGGVAKCDTKSGYQKCKDGTRSSTCKC